MLENMISGYGVERVGGRQNGDHLEIVALIWCQGTQHKPGLEPDCLGLKQAINTQ
jgi:hypothetical protein